MRKAILTIPCLVLALVAGSLLSAQTASASIAPVVWWDFNGNLNGTNGINLTGVANNNAGLTPTVDFSYAPVTGIPGLSAGGSAVKFSGSNVLKSNSHDLRIGGAQTMWMRINLSSVPTDGTLALMTRSRAVNNFRGIALQLINGRLVGYLSSTGLAYDAQVSSSSSYQLQSGIWYDISIRFDPSNTFRIDLYDPLTGMQFDSIVLTEKVPASIPTTNSIGSGYFQLGSINNGSSGSSWVVPEGTLIESAGVWNSYLSDADIARLSNIPESKAYALMIGVVIAVWALRKRTRR